MAVAVGDGMTPDFVNEVHNDIVFLYPNTVEVLPHSHCQLFLLLSSVLLFPRHCRRVQANASRS